MKKINIAYWTVTGLFSAFMLFSSIPDIMNTPEAEAFMTGHLGYPKYFTPFIGIAKVFGIIGILIPGFPRIKEWAYAGLMFDLLGAWYSVIAVGDPIGSSLFMLLPITAGMASYFLYHRKRKAEAEAYGVPSM